MVLFVQKRHKKNNSSEVWLLYLAQLSFPIKNSDKRKICVFIPVCVCVCVCIAVCRICPFQPSRSKLTPPQPIVISINSANPKRMRVPIQLQCRCKLQDGVIKQRKKAPSPVNICPQCPNPIPFNSCYLCTVEILLLFQLETIERSLSLLFLSVLTQYSHSLFQMRSSSLALHPLPLLLLHNLHAQPLTSPLLPE